jgi:hypothetical protein
MVRKYLLLLKYILLFSELLVVLLIVRKGTIHITHCRTGYMPFPPIRHCKDQHYLRLLQPELIPECIFIIQCRSNSEFRQRLPGLASIAGQFLPKETTFFSIKGFAISIAFCEFNCVFKCDRVITVGIQSAHNFYIFRLWPKSTF